MQCNQMLFEQSTTEKQLKVVTGFDHKEREKREKERENGGQGREIPMVNSQGNAVRKKKSAKE